MQKNAHVPTCMCESLEAKPQLSVFLEKGRNDCVCVLSCFRERERDFENVTACEILRS